ncbi:hypothetical protein [Streptomyces sp. NPDC002599]|uniref:hypothetical protein n=1 Tax=Streptomyces sp. NPDC002599 TaxID=3154421 RepID=UPI003319FAFD
MPTRKTADTAREHGDWAVPYQPADFTDFDPMAFSWTAKAPQPTLADVAHRLVEAEGPIHRQVLHLHAGEVLFEPRLSAGRKRLVDSAAASLVEDGRLVEVRDFFDLPDRPCMKARWPLPGLTRRPVEHVAPGERERALLGLVTDRPRGLGAEQAVAEAAAFFGWSSRTGSASGRLMSDLYRLRDSGELIGWPDKLESAGGS